MPSQLRLIKREAKLCNGGEEAGSNYSFLEKTYYILCIMIERETKEIIDQLLFLLNKCLQFLSLFLDYGTSFIGFMHDIKLLTHNNLVCLSLGLIL